MKKILFFSRGHGYGHAFPDMAIGAELRKISSDIKIMFVSYASGAKAFESTGVPVIDLNLPEANPYLETMARCIRLIKREMPDLVISHEEFSALPAAKFNEIRSVYISAWLPVKSSIGTESLNYADQIILLGAPGIFPAVFTTTTKISYVGNIIRPMKYRNSDRTRIRQELDLALDTKYLIVLPGGAASEQEFPIFDIVFDMFVRLPFAEKKLTWISAKDYRQLRKRSDQSAQFEVIQFYQPIEYLLAAADLIISKGSRGVTLDAAAVGVPSISISNGKNIIDDILVPRVRNNVALTGCATDTSALTYHVMEVINDRTRLLPITSQGLSKTVKILFDMCNNASM
jgi:UDP-N-acetylglucosamine:LPS N-acetylglucosamine transferase